jgi:hypothetical protein
MRRAAIVALALAAGAAAACGSMTGDFRLSGTVDLSPSVADRAPRGDAMLFVVAENAGGVPVAVKRIVNPEFPARYRMLPQDLIVPAVPSREPLTVHAELNTHGAVGKPRPGDLWGDAPGVVLPGAHGVDVVLDRIRR